MTLVAERRTQILDFPGLASYVLDLRPQRAGRLEEIAIDHRVASRTRIDVSALRRPLRQFHRRPDSGQGRYPRWHQVSISQ